MLTVVHTPLDARIYHRQIRALLAEGCEVTYAAPFSGYQQDPAGLEQDIQSIDVPRARGRERSTAIRAARSLLRHAGSDHDLVVMHDPELLLAVAGQLDRLPPVVWDVHEDTAAALSDRPWVPEVLRPLSSRLVRAAERWAERHLHLTLAEDSYQTRFRRPHPVVPNFPFLPPEDRVPPSGDQRVVYLGRVSARRGAHELVKLGEMLRGDVMVEIIGAADPDVERLVADACDRGTVRWHGFVPNAEALRMLGGAAAGLSLLHDEPNYRGSLPTKVLEYLAHGVPVITTPLPVAERIVGRADAGIVVPFGDVDAAAAAVRRLVADHDERLAMARRGRGFVAAHYSWDAEGPRFVETMRRWAEA